MDINELINQHERDLTKYQKIAAKSTKPEHKDRAEHCERKIEWHGAAKALLNGVATVVSAGSAPAVGALVGLAANAVGSMLDSAPECDHVVGRGWIDGSTTVIRTSERSPFHPHPRNWTELYRFCPCCGTENDTVTDVQGSDRNSIFLECST